MDGNVAAAWASAVAAAVFGGATLAFRRSPWALQAIAAGALVAAALAHAATLLPAAGLSPLAIGPLAVMASGAPFAAAWAWLANRERLKSGGVALSDRAIALVATSPLDAGLAALVLAYAIGVAAWNRTNGEGRPIRRGGEFALVDRGRVVRPIAEAEYRRALNGEAQVLSAVSVSVSLWAALSLRRLRRLECRTVSPPPSEVRCDKDF